MLPSNIGWLPFEQQLNYKVSHGVRCWESVSSTKLRLHISFLASAFACTRGWRFWLWGRLVRNSSNFYTWRHK